MEKPNFEKDSTYLPCTLQQFQDLTNEILIEFNKLIAPSALDGNYFADVLNGVIHSLDRKTARVSKQDLFDGCVNLVSKHVSYHAIEAMRQQLNQPSQSESDLNEDILE